MSVRIAEYFGQRVDVSSPTIYPKTKESADIQCPFMNKPCSKIQKNLKPICSVRKKSGEVWIVCRERLCSTNKGIPLTSHQKEILIDIAREVYTPEIAEEHILIKREQKIPVVEKSNYHADFIMSVVGYPEKVSGPRNIVLEMQGGGETSNTGSITRLVDAWEVREQYANDFLFQEIDAGTIETNAWRRQQEQFIIKGNIAMQTGGGIVFCVGSLLFDYLWQRVSTNRLNDLREHNWSMCLICIEEDDSKPVVAGPIPLRISKSKILFTNYISFVQMLINQGQPNPEMFAGEFETLSGSTVRL